MGGQLDGNFLPGRLPHKFILIVTSIICFWSIIFFSRYVFPVLWMASHFHFHDSLNFGRRKFFEKKKEQNSVRRKCGFKAHAKTSRLGAEYELQCINISRKNLHFYLIRWNGPIYIVCCA